MQSIEKHKEKIIDLCKKYRIKELYIFGSAIREDFSESSDLDFAVDFLRDGYAGSFDQYFDFKNSLQELLKREVDLVCYSGIRNRFFKEELDKTKKLIYAA